MNDWDNLDNFPTDDDDNGADHSNDDLDLPDWLSDMDVPEVDEDEVEAAKASASTSDDGWGLDDDDDDLWDTSSEDDLAGDNSDAGDSLWGDSSFEDSEDEVGDFLFGTSSDDDTDNDSDGSDLWGFAEEKNDDDGGSVQGDDFLFGASDDADEEVDDFLFGASDDADEEVDDFLFGASDDADEEVDDFLFGASDDTSGSAVQESTGSSSLWDVSGDDDDFGWGDLADSNVFTDDPAASAEPADDLGVPDWLADMPVAGEDTTEDEPVAEDDLGVPDWLDDMPVPGEEQAFAETELEDAPDWLDDMPVPGEQVQAFDLDSLEDDWLDAVTSEDEPVAEDDLGVPDWLDDEESVAEEDDLFGSLLDEEDPVTESGDDDLFDLLGDDDMVTESGDDDLLDLLGDLDTGDDGDLDDLLASLDTGDDDGDLDDLLASLDTDDDDSDLDDLLLALDDSSDDGDLDELFAEEEPVAAVADDLDFLDELEAEPADDLDFLGLDTEPADDLDFLDELEAEAEPQSQLPDGLDFINDLASPAGEAEPVDDLDFFGELEAEAEPPQSQLPDDLDFINDLASPVEEAEPVDDLDFLGELEAEAEAGDLDFFDEMETEAEAGDLDFFEEMEAEAEAGDLDFFEEMETEVDADNLDFFEAEEAAILDELSEADDLSPDLFEEDMPDAEPAESRALAFLGKVDDDDEFDIDDDPSWLDDISGLDLDAFDQQQETQPEGVDLDALIDSFDVDEPAEDQELEDLVPSANLDSFFEELDQQETEKSDDVPAEALPEWLQAIAQGDDVSESAASLLRERENRSLNELDERLLDLRERGIEVTSSSDRDEEHEAPVTSGNLSKIIPNVDDALVPASMTPGQSALVTEPTITPEQAQRTEILQSLVGSAVGDVTTEDSPSAATNILQAIVSRADRFIIAVILIAAVIAPFAYPTFDSISVLPQNEFAPDVPEFAAFDLIENLEPNQYVLIGAEYGAAGARELDTATRSLLEHIIINKAIPVVVSSDAVGLLRTENIVVELLGEDVRNAGFYIAGLLPGGNVGLRDFSANLSSVIGTDIRGADINIDVSSLDDFGAIVLISESGENVRNWMEQIAPVTDTSIIVVAAQSASPIALPYVDSTDNVVAMLTSYDDAYTYQQMSLALYNPSPTPTPSPTLSPTPTLTSTATSTPTDIPTSTPTDVPPTATNVPTEEPTEEPEEEAAPVETEAVEETPEEEVVETEEAEASAQETDEPTSEPTDEPTATEPPTEEAESNTSETVQIGTVIADGRVNVRSGAGGDFAAVAGLDPGTEVRIIGTSDDGNWYNIVLPNNGEGWIADFLLSVEEIPTDEWQGASKDGFLPVYFSNRGIRVAQADTEEDDDVVLVGRNASGITAPVYADNTQETVLAEIANNTEFLVIEEGDALTQILLEDGQTGFIETRLIRIEERQRSEVQFAPTLTPTLTPSPTFTPSPSPSPTPILPEITPAPFADPQTRSSSQSLGLLVAIVVIAIGNLFWIFRWLGQRNK